MKVVPVRLPVEMLDRIEALVGAYKRPEFIREAVERELQRRGK